MYSKVAIVLFLVTNLMTCVQAQEKNVSAGLNGYISTMQSGIFEKIDDPWVNDNLLHNRINFKAYFFNRVTFVAGLRTRIFTGDMVQAGNGYADMIGADRGWADLSFNLVDENSLLWNSTFDRLYIDISGKGYQLDIGRQRINWGQAFVWNPNDIFNAYSYFDFDYVERPGSDAVRLQLYPSFSSTIDMAVKIDSDNKITAGALYRFNIMGYDIQFIGGYVEDENLILGTGWSGAFGSTSFRGEASWFKPLKNSTDTSGAVMLTIGLDRSFPDNSILQFELMYCNNPKKLDNFDSFYSGTLSARDLAFSKFSLFAGLNVPITPLLHLGASGIYYPGLKGFFAGPSIDYSLSENVDFSFFWQHFEAETVSQDLNMNLAFLRVKYSF